MSLKDLPTPDPKKLSRYHDNYFDALVDEALDDVDFNKIVEDLEDRILNGDFNPMKGGGTDGRQ